jgi:hypothetical protein
MKEVQFFFRVSERLSPPLSQTSWAVCMGEVWNPLSESTVVMANWFDVSAFQSSTSGSCALFASVFEIFLSFF